MLDKLKTLEKNIGELRSLKTRFSSTARDDLTEKWALRYGLFESIQIIIDISCHIVSKFNLGNPQNYRQCIEILQQNGYITADLSNKLQAMIGLRNILVHEYMAIDDNKLREFLDRVDDMLAFAHACARYIEE